MPPMYSLTNRLRHSSAGGAIFEGYHESSQQTVFVKCHQVSADGQREYHILQQVQGEGVVQCLDAIQGPFNTYYIITAFVPNGNLFHRIQSMVQKKTGGCFFLYVHISLQYKQL